VGPDAVAQLRCGDARPHREGHEVDDLLRVDVEEASAEQQVGRGIHHDAERAGAPSSDETRAAALSRAGTRPSTPSYGSTTFGTETETAAATRPSGVCQESRCSSDGNPRPQREVGGFGL